MERGLRFAGERDAGCFEPRSAALFGLLVLSILAPLCIYLLPPLCCPKELENGSQDLHRKLGFVCVISDPCAHSHYLIRALGRLERGMGPGLMVSTSMGN